MKNHNKKLRLISFSATLIIILFSFLVNLSCGGGGGGGGDATTIPTTTPDQTGSVRGTVYDVNGSPLEGAAVSWETYQTDSEKQTLSTVTDANGNFFLNNIPVGNIIITAVKGNYAVCQQVSVNPNETTDDDFQVEPVGSLEGYVYDANSNSPISGALLLLTIDKWYATLVEKTDSSGKYRYPYLAEGSHKITVSSQGYYSQTSQVVITAEETTVVDFSLAPGSSPEPVPTPTSTISPVPTVSPTSSPTSSPTASPTISPTASPTGSPTPTPSPTQPVSSGRIITFNCSADNLVEGDTNNCFDIFTHDQETGITKRVSVNSDGTQMTSGSDVNSISGDFRYVAFQSTTIIDGYGKHDVYLHDRQTGVTKLVSKDSSGNPGDGCATDPSISGNGRYITFASGSTNLIPNDNNNSTDIFVYDQQNDEMSRVSVNSSGVAANLYSSYPKISGDGRYVIFKSAADNLVTGDTNGVDDIFLHDRQTHQTIRVTVSSSGEQANYYSQNPSISYDGRFVVFESLASNLVNGDTNNKTDVFIHNINTGETTRVSVSPEGIQGDAGSSTPSISENGRYVCFTSDSTNLVENDNNGEYDVFVRDLQTGQNEIIDVSNTGEKPNAFVQHPILSRDARYIAFGSYASNIIEGDTNEFRDIFVYDRQTGLTKRVSVNSEGTQANRDSWFYDIK